MSKGTNIGKAYVQIVPSAEKIKGSITDALGDEPQSAGKIGGIKLATAIKSAIVAAGVGKAISASLMAGGALQQSIGGVETLFKGSADKVKQYASEAFQTTGLSANAYMESVTSFSASLLQSLGGDTAAAADVANMAMVDMSDNANKMGTDMQSIQDAYQGFAKQNYTMLDNLKLGYGGTKTEMERLLADATKLTGVKYDINNLSDVYKAIHAIQENLDITGTTALEASTTLIGSFNSMKAAATDFLGALSLGMDVSVPMKNMVTSASTFFFGNMLPMIGNVVAAVPQAVITAITTAVPIIGEQIGIMFQNMATFMTQQFPKLVIKGKETIDNFVTGFVNNFPLFMKNLSDMINNSIIWLMQNLPKFIGQGADLVLHLVEGLVQMLPTFVNNIIHLVTSAVATFGQNLPQFISKGSELLGNVVSGLLNAVPRLLGAIPGILVNAAHAFMNYDWWSIGSNIVSGIVNGIVSAGSQIASTLMNIARNAFNSVKKFLGIKSPSRLFRDQIGKMIPAGIAVGIESDNTLPEQVKAMAERTVAEARLNFSNADIVTRTMFNLPSKFDNLNNSGTTMNHTVNQTINSAKQLSPSEIARETKNMMRRLEWQ